MPPAPSTPLRADDLLGCPILAQRRWGRDDRIQVVCASRPATSAACTAETLDRNGSGDHHWDYGYNDRSELTGGNRRTGTDPGQGTNFSPNGDFDYLYDPIGNRSESNVDGASPAMTYTATSLTQYAPAATPFRFSTKWFDAEVDYTTNDGLYYYGYRYYTPRVSHDRLQ